MTRRPVTRKVHPLRAARMAKGLSQEALADKAQVGGGKGSISRYETWKLYPTFVIRKKIAKALRWPATRLGELFPP